MTYIYLATIAITLFFAVVYFNNRTKKSKKPLSPIESGDDILNRRYPKLISLRKSDHNNFNGFYRHMLEGIEDGESMEPNQQIRIDAFMRNIDCAEWLKKENPIQIAIVLQHTFSIIEKTNHDFTVKLYFNNKQETLKIPYEEIHLMADMQLDLGVIRPNSPLLNNHNPDENL